MLGDVKGDAVPEVAVGRFIATNAAGLSNMVYKTIWYDITEAWKDTALFFADVPEVGTVYDFTAIASDTSLNFEDGGWTADRIFAGQGDASRLDLLWKNSIAQTGAYYKLLSGVGFFYFNGHSSDTLAGGGDGTKHFLTRDILNEADWPFAPAALLLGCRLGRWNRCIANSYAINAAGARNPTSGFAAVISPAGYMDPADARDYSLAFGKAVGAGAQRLGDAWRVAFEIMGGAAAERLRHMTFLGDPALTVSAGRTARGTPSGWLIGHGLTGDPYADLADHDEDGFETWKEYQAGTSPFQGGVRLRAPDVTGVTEGLPLSFEAVAGYAYRVLSCTNLAAGVWEAVPWRAGPGEAWSQDVIYGDWPLKSVEVPYDTGEKSRFYKIVSE